MKKGAPLEQNLGDAPSPFITFDPLSEYVKNKILEFSDIV